MTELEWMDIFGDNLKEILKEANMSQNDLARKTGIERSTISRYVNKICMPSLKSVINISHALNCDLSDLIDFGDKVY